METVTVKWWKSKDAWTIIGTALTALGLSFCSAYFLQWPWNLIGAIIPCIPAGTIIRKMIIKIFTKKLSDNKTIEEP